VEVTDDCDGCKYCLVAFECPALELNSGTGRVEVDRRTCVDCGQCIKACYKGYIVEKDVATDLELPGKLGMDQRFIP
jgi:indolepyruvate ferredoxin oxidoreductase alpha subunit